MLDYTYLLSLAIILFSTKVFFYSILQKNDKRKTAKVVTPSRL